MGVLNVTPDSFSDGGLYLDPQRALERAQAMVGEGAAIIDVGGESTRPGAAPVAVEEELRRVLPVVRALARASPIVVSVDTSRPEVIERAVGEGAAMINDVRALQGRGALAAVARTGAAACLMHMRGQPENMQLAVRYEEVVSEVRGFLAARLAACQEAGIEAMRLCVDPGFGFGKLAQHNLELLRNLGELLELDRPVLVGLSRKSLLKTLTGRDSGERLAGSIALATAAALNGATIIRAHDVAATVDALRVAAALKR
ncbi:MAG: dihydropteroate synthase [Gammaproteobacteria bacterium]|nr:dihydropteroate synthase [Gammaproteobacteria bacterium]MDE2251813.1 dihydropteroate synthase [Gammaproteobacteria bacterium]